jgi:hypothetical protein
VTGPYVGAAWGLAFGNREIDDANSSNSEGLGRTGKVYAGYQLTERLGLQAGYVRVRRLNQNTGSGATMVKQTVAGHSSYLAGTARLPLGPSIALTGKLGVSFGSVSDASPATDATPARLGHRTALLIGTGVAWVLSHDVSLCVELDSYGKMSPTVKANSLTVGAQFRY